nr:uncharacterized protein LOC112578175 [Bubalus bubalis]
MPFGGDRALISALTAAVPAARKRGASSGGDWGLWAVSVLISSVTFKLSLEAAAAADHDQGLGAPRQRILPLITDKDNKCTGLSTRNQAHDDYMLSKTRHK